MTARRASGAAAAAHDSDLETALAGLAVRAPDTLAPATLVAVGLADRYAELPSPLGPIVVAWNGRGISAVDRAVDLDDFEARFAEQVRRPLQRAEAVPADLARAIAARIAGDRRVRIPLDLRGRTEFESAVLMKALEIPRGEVRPYGWIAAEIGRPRAVRAVGTALAHNPVPLVVPCHRVVRSDGCIGQYSLGGTGREADDPGRRGPRSRVAGGQGARQDPFPRLGHDPHRLPANLPQREANHASPPGPVPLAGLRDGGRVPGVPRVPAGLGELSCRRLRDHRATATEAQPSPTGLGQRCRLHSLDLGPPDYAKAYRRPRPVGGDGDDLRRLGFHLPGHRDRDRDDPAVPHARHPLRHRRRRPVRLGGRPARA